MRIRFLNRAVVATVFVLSGCEAMEGGLFTSASTPDAQVAPAAKAPAASRTETATVAPVARPGIKPRPAVQSINPKILLGKSQSDAQAVLGPPAVVQNSPPATIWRYTAEGCTLDVFFYMDLGTNSLRALDYEAKTADSVASDDAIAQCVGLVQVTNRAGSR